MPRRNGRYSVITKRTGVKTLKALGARHVTTAEDGFVAALLKKTQDPRKTRPMFLNMANSLFLSSPKGLLLSEIRPVTREAPKESLGQCKNREDRQIDNQGDEQRIVQPVQLFRPRRSLFNKLRRKLGLSQ